MRRKIYCKGRHHDAKPREWKFLQEIPQAHVSLARFCYILTKPWTHLFGHCLFLFLYAHCLLTPTRRRRLGLFFLSPPPIIHPFPLISVVSFLRFVLPTHIPDNQMANGSLEGVGSLVANALNSKSKRQGSTPDRSRGKWWVVGGGGEGGGWWWGSKGTLKCATTQRTRKGQHLQVYCRQIRRIGSIRHPLQTTPAISSSFVLFSSALA